MTIAKYALLAVALMLAPIATAVTTSSEAEARCKNCRNAKVVKRTRRTVRRVRRPVRTVVKRTKEFRIKRVRYKRTTRIVTHIIPTYQIRKVKTVFVQKIVSRDNRRVRVGKGRRRTVRRVRGGRGIRESYVVQRGDSLSVIAQRSGLSVAQLKRRNGITNPRNIIKPGQRLIIR